MNEIQPTELIQDAIKLAETWQNRANDLLTNEERTIQDTMKRLLTHPMDKVILTRMMDQSFRPHGVRRVANQLDFLLRTYGIPSFFNPMEKFLMHLFQRVGKFLPAISIPRVIEKMRADSRRAIIPGEPEFLYPHLQKRRQEGVRMNLNHLGEAVLGEEESANRLETYIHDLKNPEIEYISVKISTIYSQISSLAFDHTVTVLKERLARLYRTARDNRYIQKDGTQVPKFVNLDMEDYRDLDITRTVFTQTLDEPEFNDHAAGIVLQAYLPDSFAIQQKLTEWAQRRVASGGAPIKIRIVKGANMEMELVESALNNWPLAPYDNKLDVDANYKRMVDYGMVLDRSRAVHLGIASHNLFELAYAYTVAQRHQVLPYFSFEMLEGMADHIRRAIQEVSGEVLLYAPVASQDQFINAIAYLIRRLDENTAAENFLRYSFNLKTGSNEWSFLKNQFVRSVHHRESAPDMPNRIQNRLTETVSAHMGTFYTRAFVNEPDTDWSLAPNREWAEQIRNKWKKAASDPPMEIPVVIAGQDIWDDRETRDCNDLSQIKPHQAKPVTVARYALAQADDIETAVKTARMDPDGWRTKSLEERHEILGRVAMELRQARADLIGAAAANTGKVFSESDPEVSEAIDFAEFYPWSARTFCNRRGVSASGKGVGLVISPWNFPIAIPCGGITASLAAGNTVIFKPASAAVLVAWELCQCFWRAGVSQNTLQFVPCSGSSTGARLVRHSGVDFIILTGGTETGMAMLKDRPDVILAAETGGKNATIVTAMSDRDQAIKNVIHSAFGHCGQKCSATSLLILEKEVYEDELFKKQLADAARSLKTGSAWDFENQLGPMITEPAGDLKNGLTRLEHGESWLLKPQNMDDHPGMWTPGIKWGVQAGSYTHQTEFFGPVLGVMCAKNLSDAIDITNQTGYGLTSGLESLDTREQEIWKNRIRAGNLYMNRGTTGAIVLRQPFGGMGKSALGAGIKAGGPNYVAQFMNFEETAMPETGAVKTDSSLSRLIKRWTIKRLWNGFNGFSSDIEKTIRAIESCLYHLEQEFGIETDYFHLRGQDNVLRYLPAGHVVIRIHPDDSLFETLTRVAAARIVGCQVTLSAEPGLVGPVTSFLSTHEGREFLGKAEITIQTDADLIKSLPKIDRLRYAASDRVPQSVYEAAARIGFYIARTPVLMDGRIELLHYIREQSICNTWHRYGNLGERGLV
ncbi:MAG: proline dehydrogenase family protein [Desulfatirhabdiaceae bacterium]